jgi:hypothetical protein
VDSLFVADGDRVVKGRQMIGKLIGKAIRVATLPIDTVNAALNIAAGGNGSKRSRTSDEMTVFGALEKARDRAAEAAEGIDEGQ